MRIELLEQRHGPLGIENAGDRVEVADAEAVRLIEAGKAVPVRDFAPERAVAKPKRERAAK